MVDAHRGLDLSRSPADALALSGGAPVELASRIARVRVPERAVELGMSLGAAERELAGEPRRPDVLDLTHADTRRFPPPPWALEEFGAAAETGHAYTAYRGDPRVRRDLAPNLGRFLGGDVDPDRELIITPGTQGALFTALAALVEPGDQVGLVDPDYLSTERTIRYLGASVAHVPLVWESRDRTLNLDAVEEVLSAGARLLVFSHPNNPTGAVYSPSAITQIAAMANRWNATVVVDELYSRMVYDDAPFVHLRGEEGMSERCITLLGPSKTESLSGYRLGVAVAPPHVVDAMEDVQAIMTIRAPAFAQPLLRRWLKDDHEFVRERIVQFQALRDITIEALGTSNIARASKPGGSAYLLVDVSEVGWPDQDLVRHLQREARVVVSPGYQFGPAAIGSFRLCFGQDETTWADVMKRIVSTLERLEH